jgi:hypothetical protein
MNEFDNNTSQFENILSLDPEDLLQWLNSNFLEDIPIAINNVEDLKNAGVLLGKLTNIYSYLVSLSMFAKLKVREAKKDKENKENIDKAIDRKEIINSYADVIKCQYNAVSRMVTVKKQIDEEMKMI